MTYLGETISLCVAISWTATALCFEYAGKRTGALNLNIIRLLMAMVMLGITLTFTSGSAVPFDAGGEAWLWLGVSGLVGYVFGDFCLLNSYNIIGSRFGQLFMTLAPPAAAISGYFLLGEELGIKAIAGMAVTLLGIGISITGGTETVDSHKRHGITLPLNGVLFGIGAGIGQGVGLVFSKMGMDAYIAHIPPQTPLEEMMIPFASTQIRAITGLAGFLVIMAARRGGKSLMMSMKNGRAMTAAAGGTFFGPFLGVSLSLLAVQFTEAGIASTLMALTPIMILLPSHLFFKEKVTARQIAGAFVSVAGTSLFFI